MAKKEPKVTSELTRQLKEIADVIKGDTFDNIQANSGISQWVKYIGELMAENSGSGGGSGTEIIPLVLEGLLFDMNMNEVSKSQLLDYLNDTSKIVTINNSIVRRVFRDSKLLTASCYSSSVTPIVDGIKIDYCILSYLKSTLTLDYVETTINNGGTVTTETTPIELS